MELVILAVLLGWIAMSVIVVGLCVAAARGDASLRATERRLPDGLVRRHRAVTPSGAAARRRVHL